jgi:hypothetical protein
VFSGLNNGDLVHQHGTDTEKQEGIHGGGRTGMLPGECQVLSSGNLFRAGFSRDMQENIYRYFCPS